MTVWKKNIFLFPSSWCRQRKSTNLQILSQPRKIHQIQDTIRRIYLHSEIYTQRIEEIPGSKRKAHRNGLSNHSTIFLQTIFYKAVTTSYYTHKATTKKKNWLYLKANKFNLIETEQITSKCKPLVIIKLYFFRFVCNFQIVNVELFCISC